MPPIPLLIVDAANVVGSVPDGWWRDRAAATARLRDALRTVSERGLPTAGLAPPLEIILVVEGAARHTTAIPDINVVAAPHSGDDAIVELVGSTAPQRPVVVITADRELRRRVQALGADVLGPKVVRR